jgi:hypothetical protein
MDRSTQNSKLKIKTQNLELRTYFDCLSLRIVWFGTGEKSGAWNSDARIYQNSGFPFIREPPTTASNLLG